MHVIFEISHGTIDAGHTYSLRSKIDDSTLY